MFRRRSRTWWICSSGGVCQVRNNLFHEEKYIGSPKAQSRDEAIVSEALWVLRLTSEKAPKLNCDRALPPEAPQIQ